MAKTKLIAKSKSPNHKHINGDIKIVFGANGIFETTDKAEIAELKRFNGKEWNVIGEQDVEKMKEEQAMREATEKEVEKKVNFLKDIKNKTVEAELKLEKLLNEIKNAEAKLKEVPKTPKPKSK